MGVLPRAGTVFLLVSGDKVILAGQTTHPLPRPDRRQRLESGGACFSGGAVRLNEHNIIDNTYDKDPDHFPLSTDPERSLSFRTNINGISTGVLILLCAL